MRSKASDIAVESSFSAAEAPSEVSMKANPEFGAAAETVSDP